jgi:hypothetical protein
LRDDQKIYRPKLALFVSPAAPKLGLKRALNFKI